MVPCPVTGSVLLVLGCALACGWIKTHWLEQLPLPKLWMLLCFTDLSSLFTTSGCCLMSLMLSVPSTVTLKVTQGLLNVALLPHLSLWAAGWVQILQQSLYFACFYYRYARDYVVEGEPYAGYDRHNAEVAAFHLDRYGVTVLPAFVVSDHCFFSWGKMSSLREYTSDLSPNTP